MLLKSSNQALVSGTLSRDAEIRTTANGTKVGKASIKYASVKNDEGGWDAKWIDITGWRDMADEIGAFSKGDAVLATGTFSEREYTGRDGTQKKSYEITVDFVVSMGQKKNNVLEGAKAIEAIQGMLNGDLDDTAMTDDASLPF